MYIRHEDPKFMTELKFKNKKLMTNSYFLTQLFKKIKNGYSPSVVIVGCQRGGKSFVGLWLAIFFSKLFEKEWDMKSNTFYEPEKLIGSYENKYHEALLCDEAGDIMDYTEWYTQTTKAINSIINTQAFRGNLYIFVTPFYGHVVKRVRIHFDFLIKMLSRGRFKVFRLVKKYDEPDLSKAVYRIFLDDMRINLNDLPEGFYEEYDKFSITQKNILRELKKGKAEEAYNKFMQMYYNKGVISG